jgi:hypothetical protein
MSAAIGGRRYPSAGVPLQDRPTELTGLHVLTTISQKQQRRRYSTRDDEADQKSSLILVEPEASTNDLLSQNSIFFQR